MSQRQRVKVNQMTDVESETFIEDNMVFIYDKDNDVFVGKNTREIDIVLKSPDGTLRKLIVDDSGILDTEEII